MDWHRHFKTTLEPKVSPFIDYVRALYDNVHLSIEEHFSGRGDGNSHEPRDETKIVNIVDADVDHCEISAIRSFRVLAEAPIDIVILFQIHRKWMTENIGLILPSVVKVNFLAKALLLEN